MNAVWLVLLMLLFAPMVIYYNWVREISELQAMLAKEARRLRAEAKAERALQAKQEQISAAGPYRQAALTERSTPSKD